MSDTLESFWPELEGAFREIVDTVKGGFAQRIPFGFDRYMKLYHIVYQLCSGESADGQATNTVADALYERYRDCLEGFLRGEKPEVVRIDREGAGPTAFLGRLSHLWSHHRVVARWMEKLFAYMDKFYTAHCPKPPLHACGLQAFRTIVYEETKERIRDSILAAVAAQREGDLTDHSLLSSVVGIYLEMGEDVYQHDFQQPFLDASARHYRQQAKRWVDDMSATQYLLAAEEALRKEDETSVRFLHDSTIPELVRGCQLSFLVWVPIVLTVVEEELLATHQRTILEMEASGFLALVRDSKLPDLQRMFRLFSRLKTAGLEPMAVMLKGHVTCEGMALVRKHSEDTQDLDCKRYVGDMLELHDRYFGLLREVFQGNNVFVRALGEAFQSFINQPLSCSQVSRTQFFTAATKLPSAELLSSYCDIILRDSRDRLGDEELDSLLDKVVTLFGYMDNQDLFLEFTRRHLSRRLLMTSVNTEAERAFTQKLKMKCGAPNTSKLEGMMRDKDTSDGTWQVQFRQWLQEKGIRPRVDFTMQILTHGFWPGFRHDTLDCPPQVEEMMTRFKEFYDEKTSSRLLKWVHSMGSATLVARFPSRGSWELSMQAHQASTLLLFNENRELKAGSIPQMMSATWDDIRRALVSLTRGLCRVLLLRRGSDKVVKDIKEDDVVCLNLEFSAASRKLRVPTVIARFNPRQTQTVVEQVEQDRKHTIDACVVRILKSRKTIRHKDLIDLVIRQLSSSFQPDPQAIKRRVEDLISREYIERDSLQKDLYRYLAAVRRHGVLTQSWSLRC